MYEDVGSLNFALGLLSISFFICYLDNLDPLSFQTTSRDVSLVQNLAK